MNEPLWKHSRLSGFARQFPGPGRSKSKKCSRGTGLLAFLNFVLGTFDALLRDFGNGWPFPWKNRREAHTSCPSARHPAKITQDFFQISTYRITDCHPKCFDLPMCLLLPKDCEILRTLQNILFLSIKNPHGWEPQSLTFSAFFLMEEQIHGHRSC